METMRSPVTFFPVALCLGFLLLRPTSSSQTNVIISYSLTRTRSKHSASC